MDPVKTSRVIIGRMIELLREKGNMSQQELALLLDVDRQYIWRLENGRVNITANYLDKVIQQLNCKHSDFLNIPPEKDGQPMQHTDLSLEP